MIKLYIFFVLSLLGLVIYGADWWLEFNDLTWNYIRRLWIFWLFSGLVGFFLAGFLLFTLAEFTLRGERKTLRDEFNADMHAYEERLNKINLSRSESISEREDTILKREQLAESRIVEAQEIRDDVDRQIIEARADIEKYRKSAFNATKTVERLRRKMEKLEST